MNSANLTKRVLVSIVAIPLILLVSYFGAIYFYIFVLILSLIAYHEFANIAKKKNADVNLYLGLFIIAVLISNQYKPFIGLFTLFLISIIFLSLAELFRNKSSAVLNLATTFFGILYIGLFGASLIAIREFYPVVDDLYTRGGFIIISMLASIWICDSAAYFLGSAFGKHKLFPRISPNKSWEGAIAGFIFAILTMAAARLIILDFLSWQSVIVLGCIIGIIGQFGDLVESMFKRDAGIKDSSTLIPGHGGVFDRFDSLLFTAPVVWLYLKYFV